MDVFEPLFIGLTVGVQMARNVEEPNFDLAFGSRSGHGQCVATIFARPGKESEMVGLGIETQKRVGGFLCRTLHQVERSDAFFVDGGGVEFLYLCRRKDFLHGVVNCSLSFSCILQKRKVQDKIRTARAGVFFCAGRLVGQDIRRK